MNNEQNIENIKSTENLQLSKFSEIMIEEGTHGSDSSRNAITENDINLEDLYYDDSTKKIVINPLVTP